MGQLMVKVFAILGALVATALGGWVILIMMEAKDARNGGKTYDWWDDEEK